MKSGYLILDRNGLNFELKCVCLVWCKEKKIVVLKFSMLLGCLFPDPPTIFNNTTSYWLRK
jgi:hypothetical protein